ncbi:hypothetical protein POF50_008155 [Streptomyces sp. SL13]|uniref:HTH cro/C1-type domain-containing protein n=1 Tax=Streptantibioticus silvisoli TaxID=2705255 RepID=A0AA90H313_9ACTN|nr:hypothetical protein [Streptantibioticus silvisoli]MDI5969317.1 hypothetical protein [Streptantibioticus silvisoli]
MRGRPESPLNPTEGPVQELAYGLRRLREEAGRPSYREMAGRSGFGASTLSQAAAGERLVTLPVVLAYVRACGGDVPEWERRWYQVQEEVARCRPAADGVAPYRGLRRFEPGDRDLFFGREDFLTRLTAALRGRRLLAVVGASGSGKSSLLRAGLLPVLQATAPAQWPIAALRIFTPGPRPFTDHADRLEPDPGAGETVVVVDQFEELFTLCADPAERTGFLDLLPTAVALGSRLRVVIAVRADFFDRCVEHPALADAVQEATLVLGPMGPARLREAITGPAAACGLVVERALTARIIREVAGEPGGLPLMSHALLETWRLRRGRALTVAMYEATGGIHGAIARTAEDVYTRLTADEADTARRILLRLITPGDGARDTRRPADRGELDADRPETGRVLERLADARLLTLEGDGVDLAHEALITAWPRLHTWVDEARDRLRVHRRLTQDARTWHELGRDPGGLYRGIRLAAACETFGGHRHELTGLEDAFLTAGTTARDHEQRAVLRATRRLRALTATLTVLLILAAGTSGYALHQQHTATTARRQAQSRQLAAQSVETEDSDPDQSSLLAVRAWRTSHTTEAAEALYSAPDLSLRQRLVSDTPVDSVAFSPDGGTLAAVMGTAGSEYVDLWNTATGGVRATLSVGNEEVNALAFGPGGTLIAASRTSTREVVRRWDARTGKPLGTISAGNAQATSVGFSPDGATLAVGTADAVGLWDTATGKRRRTFVLEGAEEADSVAFSPDGRTLAGGTDDGTVRLWNLDGRGQSTDVEVGPDNVDSVAFSPDSRTLAAGTDGGTVRLWDLDDRGTSVTVEVVPGDVVVETGAGEVSSVAFSPDGAVLATGENPDSDDEKVGLWDARTGKARGALKVGAAQVDSVAFSPNGGTLAAGTSPSAVTGTIRLWDTGNGRLRTTFAAGAGYVSSVAFGQDGGTLATTTANITDGGVGVGAGGRGSARLWDARSGARRSSLAVGAQDVSAMTFSPDEKTVAAGASDGQVRLWKTGSGTSRAALKLGSGSVNTLAFSPDSTTVAAGGSDGQVRLWNAGSGTSRAVLGLGSGSVDALAFSPDGETVAAGDGDGDVRLWSVASGATRVSFTVGAGSVSAIAFSPDGTTLATGDSQGDVLLWDTASGRLRKTLVAEGGYMSAMTFSPDGRTLAVAVADGADASGVLSGDVQLLDVASGELRDSLAVDSAYVSAVAFGPHGTTLAAGTDDGRADVWSVDLPDAQAISSTICASLRCS